MKIFVIAFFILASSSVIPFVTNIHALGFEAYGQDQFVNSTPEPTKHRDPFVFGTWAFPIITTNLILLALGISYYKKRLPKLIEEKINFIFNFEVSQKVAFLVVIILLAIDIGFGINEIKNSKEEPGGDYAIAVSEAKSWGGIHTTLSIDSFVRFTLLSVSLNIFGNIRIIPFIISISLLIVTYFTTVTLSKKRFAGIISMAVLLQSNLFWRYNTVATEDNAWTLFYLLSLYLIYKKPFLSPISYILSLFSKPLVAVFLPMTFFFTYRANISRKIKIRTALVYVAITAVVLLAIIAGKAQVGSLSFHPNEFLTGFTTLGIFLPFDGLVLVFLLPLIIGLYIISRKGILQAESVMILISGSLLSAPLLTGIADITNQAYRLIPFVVFFAIGIGTLFSNNTQLVEPHSKKLVSTIVFLIALTTVIIFLTLVIFPDLIVRSYRQVL